MSSPAPPDTSQPLPAESQTTAEAPARAAAPALSDMQSRIAVITVGAAVFIQFVDSTALSTALPMLAKSFGESPVRLRLVLTSYLIAQALFLPLSGWAADRFGPRRVFMTAISVFLAGSLLSGLSQTLPQLIAARALQGMGGAMMLPVGRIIVVASSPREKLVQAMMWFGMPAMAGPILGPPLAGFILSVADWPWIFFVNIPIGLVGLLGVARFVPRIRQPDPGPFDLIGFVLSAGAIGGVMVLVEAVDYSVAVQLVAGLAAVLSTLAYLRHARRRAAAGGRPILDLSLLKYPSFRLSCTGGALVRLGIGGTPYLLALLLQLGMGWTPLQAGLVATTSAVGALASRPVAPSVIQKLGFRRMLWTTAVMIGVLGVAPGLFHHTTPIPLVLGVLVITGLMRAAHFGAVNALGFADIPPAQVSASSTLSTVIQQISLSLGVTLASLTLHLAQHGSETLSPEVFLLPFAVVGGLSLLAVPLYLRLPINAGAEISGGRRRG